MKADLQGQVGAGRQTPDGELEESVGLGRRGRSGSMAERFAEVLGMDGDTGAGPGTAAENG